MTRKCHLVHNRSWYSHHNKLWDARQWWPSKENLSQSLLRSTYHWCKPWHPCPKAALSHSISILQIPRKWMCVEKALTEERKNVKSFVFVHFSFQYHQIKLGPLSFSISVKRRAHKREEKLIEVLSTSFVVISIEALSYKDSLSCSILGCCWSIFIAYYRNGRSVNISLGVCIIENIYTRFYDKQHTTRQYYLFLTCHIS